MDVLFVKEDKVEEFIEKNPEYCVTTQLYNDVLNLKLKDGLFILAKKLFTIKIAEIIMEEQKNQSHSEININDFQEKMIRLAIENNVIYSVGHKSFHYCFTIRV